MDSALIVSCVEKTTEYFIDVLNTASFEHISVSHSCGEARRLMLEREFDLVIINAPLRDETGEALAIRLASKDICQVILAVKNEFFDAVSETAENEGVLVVAKPLNKTIFWSALQLARSAGKRLTKMRTENNKLKQKIEDIRVINRAKYILISYLNMSEQEAHRYIEKHAMDMRQTRRAVAEDILKTYEN